MEAVKEGPRVQVLTPSVDKSLSPIAADERQLTPWSYMAMWLGDGVNLGNMTLGSGLFAYGVMILSFSQTLVAALIAIGIISIIFSLNDQVGYRYGVPYVVQLRMSFGFKGATISALMRGIPAIVWYGFQSWIGAVALNYIIGYFVSGFDNKVACFVALQVVQIGISIYGFHSIKWVESIISLVIIAAMAYLAFLLIRDHSDQIVSKWFEAKGSWFGKEFWMLIVAFLGNYAAIFLSAADYSRELKPGHGPAKRSLYYFLPIVLAYGATLMIGGMLAAVTEDAMPVEAMKAIFNNDQISLFVNIFIVLGVIAVNMVANIIAPAYVLQQFTGMKYKFAVVVVGILAMCTFPWKLTSSESSEGLATFIRIYSAFLGPIVSILLVDYYILRKRVVELKWLYDEKGPLAGLNMAAMIALVAGAVPALIFQSLSWFIGFFISAIVYIIASSALRGSSPFVKGTIFERKQ